MQTVIIQAAISTEDKAKQEKDVNFVIRNG